jgi:hypothetical protein
MDSHWQGVHTRASAARQINAGVWMAWIGALWRRRQRLHDPKPNLTQL